jgi:hypothetical protein
MMATVDFDLHGLVGVRLLDPTMAEANAVGQQLGLSPCVLTREPDIVVRWVDGPQTSRLKIIGDHEAGYSDNAFFVLRNKYNTRARVQIPFETIGGRCEIVCESGVEGVPLLVPIINLTLLGKGIVPIHASAFLYQGKGVLAAGWSKGGKTEALLSFLAAGAQYIGDDWVYLSPHGQLFGIPEPVRLKTWHIDELPQFRKRVRRLARLRLKALGIADRWKDRPPALVRRLPTRMTGRLLHLLARQAFVTVPPQQLFADQMAQQPAPFDHLFLLASHESPQVHVEPVDPTDVARQMVFSVQEERDRFLTWYRKFRFAFPHRANPLIDDSEHLQRELLRKALAGKPAHLVLHPYPVRIPELFERMQSVFAPAAKSFVAHAGTAGSVVDRRDSSLVPIAS